MFIPTTREQFETALRVVDDLMHQLNGLNDALVPPVWDGSVSGAGTFDQYRRLTYEHFGKRDAYSASVFRLIEYSQTMTREWDAARLNGSQLP